jgi:hypothetical protein
MSDDQTTQSTTSESKFFKKARVGRPAKPAPLQMSMEMLTQLIGALQSAATQPTASPEMTAAFEALKAVSDETRALNQNVQKQVRPSNADHLHQSDFETDSRCDLCRHNKAVAAGEIDGTYQLHPSTGKAGHPRPKLKFAVTLCGIVVDAEVLTPLEIELLNQFTESKEARHGKFKATLERDGTNRKLKITIPASSSDDMAGSPPLVQILSELLFGESVGDPMNAMAEIAALKRQVAELQAVRGVPA